MLSSEVAVHLCFVIAQYTVPDGCSIEGRSGPPVTAVADKLEVTGVSVAGTARKGSETAFIGITAVRTGPMSGAAFF